MRISLPSTSKLASLLVVAVLGFFAANACADGPAAHICYLAAPRQYPELGLPPLLTRELVRQAVLMGARDGLGLDTRDEVLGEWNCVPDAPADSAGPPMVIQVRWDPKRANVTVAIGHAGQSGFFYHAAMPVVHKKSDWMDMPGFVVASEAAAEDDDLKMLQQAGYTGKPNTTGDGDLPSTIDDLLYQTTLLAPLSALQQTHALIRASGESPARLGALVRGYANLGVLTRFQWSSIHKAMTARSLLYAQKMVVKNPQSPLALYHRAYAFALAGIHKAALSDLAAAADLQTQLKQAGKNPEASPPWVGLIEPLCKYDITKLQSLVGDDPHRAPLAAICCFLDVQYCGSITRLLNIGGAMLSQNPECFAILDGMTDPAGVASGHRLTEAPLPLMLQSLPKDIKRLPAIPAAVLAALAAAAHSDDHIRNLANVTAAFIGAPEEAEPSYTLAGRIIQETNFVHVERRAVFMADDWGVDCSDYVNQTLPLIADHRFKFFIQSLNHPAAIRSRVTGPLEVADPQFQMMPMLLSLEPLGKPKGKMTGETAYLRAFSNNDGSAYDLERIFYPFQKPKLHEFELDQARHFGLFSPYSGPAIAVMTALDWTKNKSHADDWLKEFHDQPVVLEAIATQYLNDYQLDKAEPIFRSCVEMAPDRETIEKLAAVYLSQGKEDQWEATLKQVLLQPDLGLDHAQVEREIAEHYMDAGEYDKARPFADASSNDSGANWAMQVASLADEYCGDYTAAEKQMQATTQRYGGVDWFMWCIRTGKGNLTAATSAADAWVQKQIAEQNTSLDDQIGLIYYLENQPGKAREFLETAMKSKHRIWAGMMASCIALELKDPKGRTADLNFVVDHCARKSNDDYDAPLVELAKLELASGDAYPPKNELVELVKPLDSSVSTNIDYFCMRLRELTGDADKAKNGYTLMLDSDDGSMWAFTLACDRLHKLGVNDTPLPRANSKGK